MKSMILVVIIVFVTAFAPVAGVKADTSVFYVNGMFNDEWEAEKSRDALEDRVRAELPNDADVRFDLVYNHNEAFDVQLREVLSQKNLDIWSTLLEIYRSGGTISGLLAESIDVLVASANVFNYVTDEDLQEHIVQYTEEINQGRDVIIVSK